MIPASGIFVAFGGGRWPGEWGPLPPVQRRSRTLTYRRLLRPVEEALTLWASCPVTGEPILAREPPVCATVTVTVDDVSVRRAVDSPTTRGDGDG